MFRTADAYLMAAEAILRGAEGGSRTEALEYVNEIRDRAYMSGKYGNGVSGRISDSRLNLDFLLMNVPTSCTWSWFAVQT